MVNPGFKWDRKVCGEAFINPETPAIVLYAIILAAYSEWIYPEHRDEDFDVDSATIWLQIKKDFDVGICLPAQNKIEAMRALAETDVFYEEVEGYRAIVNGVCHGFPEDDDGDLSIAEMTMTLLESTRVRTEHPDFSAAVLAYISDQMWNDAFSKKTGEDPVQQLLDEHRQEIVGWFVRLGADSELASTY